MDYNSFAIRLKNEKTCLAAMRRATKEIEENLNDIGFLKACYKLLKGGAMAMTAQEMVDWFEESPLSQGNEEVVRCNEAAFLDKLRARHMPDDSKRIVITAIGGKLEAWEEDRD